MTMAEIVVNVDKVSVTLGGGPNGAGKSTLLKLMAQELPLEEGNVFRKSGLTWGRLEQEPRLDDGRTVLQEALRARPELGMSGSCSG
jgi:ATPase subunit of ABC transporter with duplicated ATPase domains